MTIPCGEEMRFLVQADIDGELSPAEAARVAAHLDHCASCAELQTGLLALSGKLRQDAPKYAAPDRLRQALRAKITTLATPPPPARRRPPARPVAAFGAGFALAASLAIFLALPPGDQLPDEMVAAHIRALQPGHLIDVVSTDQHTVKPWFDGKLPFAPPVRDFAASGFPLQGGRLDYVAGHTMAALVYRHGPHVINVFVWPHDEGASDRASGSREGYNFRRWTRDGMNICAVSDLNAGELDSFVKAWRSL